MKKALRTGLALLICAATTTSLLLACGEQHTSRMDNSRNDSTAIDSSNSGANPTRDSSANPNIDRN